MESESKPVKINQYIQFVYILKNSNEQDIDR